MRPHAADRHINGLLDQQGSFAVRELAERTGLSRQALRRHLDRWLEAGRSQVRGGGRSTRYLRAVAAIELVRPTEGLHEDEVWRDLQARLRADGAIWNDRADRILAYAVTQIVNNAIDHSQASEVTVRATAQAERIDVQVVDRGIGALESVRARFGLESALHALQELTKGKVTTQPEHHSGEGLFFTSKAVDRFELHANGLVWIVDGRRGDQTVVEDTGTTGTAVRMAVDPMTDRRLEHVFLSYSTDLAFDRTRTIVRLFEYGVQFVSRSEAKRLSSGLQRFREVVVDFEGVTSVGQGFVDELFRVWAAANAGTRLVPVNMVPAVEFMVRRGLPGGPLG
ncbi:MAG: DUF4325 domain-containing protein [Planctomycetota bacterium]